jgi:hypothetical protein
VLGTVRRTAAAELARWDVAGAAGRRGGCGRGDGGGAGYSSSVRGVSPRYRALPRRGPWRGRSSLAAPCMVARQGLRHVGAASSATSTP